MIPFSYVITVTVRIVLQSDAGQEVHANKIRVYGYDFFVECHYAALTIAPLKYVNAAPVDSVWATLDKPYISM